MKRPYHIISANTEEWYQARRGKITASERLWTALYGGAKAKNTLLDTLEIEAMVGARGMRPTHKYMQWGHEHEPVARRLIEALYDCTCEDPGFLQHPKVGLLGATPDYAVYETDIVGEIKCPFYLEYHHGMRAHGLKNRPEYYVQVQGEILVAGAQAGWFSSYHPHARAGQQLYWERVEPDCNLHARMLESVLELQDMLQAGRRFGMGRTVNADGIPQIF